MPEIKYYMDESGLRHPDKKSDATRKGRDWFALGGYLIDRELEDDVRSEYDKIAKKWRINGPFHMTEMLSERKNFAWLGKIKEVRRNEFWSDYKDFLSRIPVLGTGCVIDRPGYNARGYLQKHPNNKWLLCRSAFDITIERAVKYAQHRKRKLSIVFESDVALNQTMKDYFHNLKSNGLEFDEENSKKYNPLPKEIFSQTLSTIESKPKSSKMLQIADSYIYAIARGKYDNKFGIYRHLRDEKKIINFALQEVDQIKQMGIKYYCF